MYTGQTEQPCCLCDDPETTARVDLFPRAVQLLKNGDPIAWRDIEGTISLHFCESDWSLVSELVLDAGLSPLPRCNAARASMVFREDFEALLNDVRDEPDQTPVERRLRERAEERITAYGEDPHVSEHDLVEAHIVLDAAEELGLDEATA